MTVDTRCVQCHRPTLIVDRPDGARSAVCPFCHTRYFAGVPGWEHYPPRDVRSSPG
ncbi:MAG: hypothetical protein KJ056_10125 [Acidimicrobiia bacterium]|nr:hypothetical protein [Acidimicrobiia bacterium]